MTDLILDSLRWLVAEYHVDGFRFDAAGVLCRSQNGSPSSHQPTAVLLAIKADPVLAGRKIIVEPWDAGDGAGSPNYLNGHYPLSAALEWNPDYGRALRRFIFRGGAENARAFCKALRGNHASFASRPYGAAHSVNYISCHDGFSLADYVSYNARTNADGYDDGTSHNHGAEGATADARILDLRRAQMRNLTLALVLSRGIPMLSMGCEAALSKGGNNNCYDVDGAANRLAMDVGDSELAGFTRAALALRKRESCLRGKDFYDGPDSSIVWRDANGERRGKRATRRRGRQGGSIESRGSVRQGDGQRAAAAGGDDVGLKRGSVENLVYWTVGCLLCVFNAGKDPLSISLPRAEEGQATVWRLVCITRDRDGEFFPGEDCADEEGSGDIVSVEGNSARVYRII